MWLKRADVSSARVKELQKIGSVVSFGGRLFAGMVRGRAGDGGRSGGGVWQVRGGVLYKKESNSGSDGNSNQVGDIEIGKLVSTVPSSSTRALRDTEHKNCACTWHGPLNAGRRSSCLDAHSSRNRRALQPVPPPARPLDARTATQAAACPFTALSTTWP